MYHPAKEMAENLKMNSAESGEEKHQPINISG